MRLFTSEAGANASRAFTEAAYASNADGMDPRRLSFTRQQIGELADLDNSTLNYWSREGLLRPAAGGAGKGSHRRFAFHQVTLAAILSQLRGFGISAIELRKLADRFHAAVDWLAARGIDHLNIQRVFDAYILRKAIVEDGYFAWRPESDDDFPGISRHDDKRGAVEVRLNWSQAVDFWFAKSRASDPERVPTPAELAVVESMATRGDLREFSDHRQYFDAITAICDRVPDEEVSTTSDYFYRGEDGAWHLSPDEAEAARNALSYIGVDIERLSHQIWYGSRPSRAEAS
jgi:DNA-binding transcriptional MerR regulator